MFLTESRGVSRGGREWWHELATCGCTHVRTAHYLNYQHYSVLLLFYILVFNCLNPNNIFFYLT